VIQSARAALDVGRRSLEAGQDMDRPFSLDHLNHVVIRVRDLEKSVAFYTMLGGEHQGEVAAGTLIRIGKTRQSIILQERSDYVPADVGSVDHINLMIQARDIFEVATYLKEHDVDFVGEPEVTRAGPTVNVRDPDGYVLEIRIVQPA
jgi:catechol 2,3-dioxygenase-like lactoylglutathione lyase family enzyme